MAPFKAAQWYQAAADEGDEETKEALELLNIKLKCAAANTG
jgi:hypothetical protein